MPIRVLNGLIWLSEDPIRLSEGLIKLTDGPIRISVLRWPYQALKGPVMLADDTIRSQMALYKAIRPEGPLKAGSEGHTRLSDCPVWLPEGLHYAFQGSSMALPGFQRALSGPY